MKKINLKGISKILSEKEMKNVMGGSGISCTCNGVNQGTVSSPSECCRKCGITC